VGVPGFTLVYTHAKKKAGPPARDLAIAAGRLDDAGTIAWDCIKKQSLW